jgi:hypothetical protein
VNAFIKANILTLVSVLIAIVGVYFAYKQINPDRPNIIVELKSVVTPPQVNNIKDLEATFIFRGKPVIDLSVVTFSLRNTGNVPLIGKGPKQNIVGDRITLPLTSGLKPINIELIANQPSARVEIAEPSGLSIVFDQWRTDEVIELTAYVEGKPTQEMFEIPAFSRQIIDGVVTQVQSIGGTDRRGLAAIFGGETVQNIRFIGAMACALCGSLFLFATVMITLDYFKKQQRAEQESAIWIQLLAEKVNVTDEAKARVLAENPKKLVAQLLGTTEREPLSKPATGDDVGGLLTFTVLGLVLLVFAGDTLLTTAWWAR